MFGEDRGREMRQYLLEFAGRAGVSGMRIPEHKPNTRRALALAEHARDHGRLDEVRIALMDSYWRRGRDIEDEEVLAEVACASGLDPEAAIRVLSAPDILKRVDEMRAGARSAGVTGIPTFFIGGKRLVGAQPYDILAAEAEAAGARRRS